jgi:ABC-type Mn2+/Zn2+ transport system ATPase subunit
VTGQPLLEVRDLSVVRGGTIVVDSVSFSAGPGDLVAVVGPNGAGKSSLFAALLGLLPAASGTSRSAGFAYVPQEPPQGATFPLSALDVALMGAFHRARPFRRIARSERQQALLALERVGLAEVARSSYGELSAGQRQRALVARALVQREPVLLLDEPLSGADAVSEEAILGALRDEQRAGRALILATHDLALARTRCTHALLLNGRACAFGPPDEALNAQSLREAYGDRLVMIGDAIGAIDEGSHHHGHSHGSH